MPPTRGRTRLRATFVSLFVGGLETNGGWGSRRDAKVQTISNNKNVVLEIVSSLKDDGRTLVATRDSVVEQAQRVADVAVIVSR